MNAVRSMLGWGQGAQAEASWWSLKTTGRRPLRWLWPGRVPLGKMTLLFGDPGLGKSLLALDMAARVTRGAAWPDAPTAEGGCATSCAPAGSVVLLSAEDDDGDTILPRLEAAGGDAERVIVLHSLRRREDNDELAFSLSRDLPLLAAEVAQRRDVRLVVLDPVSACLGGMDGYRNAQVRTLLAPVRAMAARLGLAVLAITHLTKRANARVLYRAMGSVAFGAAARATWAVGPDRRDPGRLLFLPVKCNLVGRVTGLAYRIVPSAGCPEVPVVAWEAEEVAMTADEAFEAPAGKPSRLLDAAVVWLAGVLAAGPVAAKEVEERGWATGFSWRTLVRAKEELGVAVRRQGYQGHWHWELADAKAAAPAEQPQPAAPAPDQGPAAAGS